MRQGAAEESYRLLHASLAIWGIVDEAQACTCLLAFESPLGSSMIVSEGKEEHLNCSWLKSV